MLRRTALVFLLALPCVTGTCGGGTWPWTNAHLQAALASVATQAGVPVLQAQLGASYVNSQLLAVVPGWSSLDGQCIPCPPGCSACAGGPLQCTSCLGGYTLVSPSAPPPAVPVPSPPPSIAGILSQLLGTPSSPASTPAGAASYGVCLPSAASGGLGAVVNNAACTLLQSANISAAVIARLPGCAPLLAKEAAAAHTPPPPSGINNTGVRLVGNATSPPPVVALSGPPAANSWLEALSTVQSAASPLAGVLAALNAVDSQLQLLNMTVLDASLFAAANSSLSQLQALANVVVPFLGNGSAPAAQQVAAALASHSVQIYVTCNSQPQANASLLQSAFWALLPEVNSVGTFSLPGKSLGTWNAANLTAVTCVLWRWNLTSDIADAVGQSVISRSAFSASSSSYTANFTSAGLTVARATFSLHISTSSAGNSSNPLSAVLAAARAYRAMVAAQSAPPPPPSPPKPPSPPPLVAALAGPPAAGGSPAGVNATALISNVLAFLGGLRQTTSPPPLPPPSNTLVSIAPAPAPVPALGPTATALAPSAAAAAPTPSAAKPPTSPPPPPPPSPGPPPPSPSTTLTVQSIQSPPVPPPPSPLPSPPPPPTNLPPPPPPSPLSMSWMTSTVTSPAPSAQQNASQASQVAAPVGKTSSSRLIILIVVLVVFGGAACGIGIIICLRRKKAAASTSELPISVSRSSRTASDLLASSPRGPRLVAIADFSESPPRKGRGSRSGG